MLTHAEIELVLRDWNHWQGEIPASLLGHPRRLTREVRSVATGREVVAVTGVRRCGKSTVQYQLISVLVGLPAGRTDRGDARV